MLRAPASPAHHGRHLLDHRVALRIDPDRFSQFSDTPSVYTPAHFSPTDDDDDTHSFEDQHDDRLSYLGPKMRFHSRAPWEVDDIEEEEFENSLPSSPKHHGFPFHLTRAGQSSSQSSTSRPSGESFQSHLLPKRSFDTINSQMSSKGALYALAQESLSTTSLSKGTPAQKDGLLGKLTSLGRSRQPVGHHTSPPTSPINSSVPRTQLNSSFEYDTLPSNRSHSATHRPSTSSQEGSVHPYANPDLLMFVAENDTNSSSTHPLPPGRNDSSVTVTQVFSSGYTPSRASSGSLLLHNPAGRKRLPSVQGRGISSPVAVQGTSLPPEMAVPEGQGPGIAQLPGWTEKFVPPAFNLISLEEARAQRARASTTADDSTLSVASLVSDLTTILNSDDSQLAPNSLTGSRSRGRTMSAGAKAKNAFHSMVGSVITERRDSEPVLALSQSNSVSQQGKPVKHKKSGFMRIFNGSKEGTLPPLPSNPSPTDVAPIKKPASRIPVPSLPQVPELTTSSRRLSASSFSELIDSAGSKRVLPVLHIDTQPTRDALGDRSYPQRMMTSLFASNAQKPWPDESHPQSAPANVKDFPSLKLRPVSALFSSHFEHIVPDFQASEVETPVSSSPTGPIYPITPSNDHFSRSEIESQGIDTKSLRVLDQSASSKLACSQQKVIELEEQVINLKAELHELRMKQQGGAYCGACGRGRNCSPFRNGPRSSASSSSSSSSGNSIVNRPRPKTGAGSSRFVNHGLI